MGSSILMKLPSQLQSWTKVLTHLSKTNAFYRRPSVTSKSIFFVDSQPPPSPPFQCCNTLRGHFHLVTTLKRGEGVEMSKLDIENSLVERNGSFSESVSTTFVYDCSFDFMLRRADSTWRDKSWRRQALMHSKQKIPNSRRTG